MPEPVAEPVADRIAFTGPYAPKKWKKKRIPGGTNTVAAVAEDTSACRFSYKVALGGGGVTERWAVFETTATATGIVTFDYRYEIYHAWFRVTAGFFTYAGAEPGSQVLEVIHFVNAQSTGPRTFAGSVAIRVEAKRKFGFRIGGSNYDSDSRLEGTLTISNFAAPAGEAAIAAPRRRAAGAGTRKREP